MAPLEPRGGSHHLLSLLLNPAACGTQCSEYPVLRIPSAQDTQCSGYPMLRIPSAQDTQCSGYPMLRIPSAQDTQCSGYGGRRNRSVSKWEGASSNPERTPVWLPSLHPPTPTLAFVKKWCGLCCEKKRKKKKKQSSCTNLTRR